LWSQALGKEEESKYKIRPNVGRNIRASRRGDTLLESSGPLVLCPSECGISRVVVVGLLMEICIFLTMTHQRDRLTVTRVAVTRVTIDDDEDPPEKKIKTIVLV
jgi:hypothetical protein